MSRSLIQVSTISYKDRLELQQQERERESLGIGHGKVTSDQCTHSTLWSQVAHTCLFTLFAVILVSVCACQKIMLWKGMPIDEWALSIGARYDGHGMCMEQQTSKATVSQPTTYCLTISRPFPMRLCIVQRAGGREQSARANLDSAIGPPRL
ncbi:hypothetical protein BHM03_00029833 [Ensete ventricosum]|nr:hypothetical protein BHM03_00029833 [Ensete ventricosum]